MSFMFSSQAVAVGNLAASIYELQGVELLRLQRTKVSGDV
jgi:hypothetical protein